MTSIDGAASSARPVLLSASLLLALVTVAILAFSGAVAAETTSTEINSCTQINESGSYQLGSDLEPDNPEEWENYDACLTINASSVTLDGMGQTIDGYSVSEAGEDVPNTKGVLVRNESHSELYRENPDGWLSDVTVKNVSFEHWSRAVRATGTDGLSVDGVDLANMVSGVDLYAQYGADLEMRDVTTSEGVGSSVILASQIERPTVDGATISREVKHQNSAVIEVRSSPGAQLTNNEIDDSDASSAPNAAVSDTYGIMVVNSTDAVVSGNEIDDLEGLTDDPDGINPDRGTGYGIFFQDHSLTDGNSNDGANVTDNTISDVDESVRVNSADDALVTENEIGWSGGITLMDSNDGSVADNEMTDVLNANSGVHIEDGSTNTVSGNNITSNGHGVHLDATTDTVVADNTIDAASRGVWVLDAVPDDVENNDISGGFSGLKLEASGDVELDALGLSDLSMDGGLTVESYSDLTLSDIEIEDGQLRLETGSYGPDLENVTITDVDITGHDDDDPAVHVTNTENVVLEDLSVVDGIDGSAMELEESSELTLENATVTGHDAEGGQWSSIQLVKIDGLEESTIDGLNVSDNPTEGSITALWVLSAETVEFTDLDVLDTGHTDGPAIEFGNSLTDVSFDGVRVSETEGGAIEVGSSEITADDVTVGAETPTETTLSFETRDAVISEASSPPDNEQATGIGAYFEASGDGDEAFLDVAVQYEDADVTGVDEETLALWNHDNSWNELEESTVDTDAQTVNANVTDFSTLGAFGEEGEPEPDISVVDASVNTTEVMEGETVIVTADVENEGDAAGDHTVEFRIEGDVEQTKPVEIAPGETKEIQFMHTFDEEGDYRVSVDEIDVATVSVTVAMGDIRVFADDAFTEEGIEAAVEIRDGDEIVYDGEFDGGSLILGVEVGTYDFVFSADGYESKTIESVEHDGAGHTDVRAELTPHPRLDVTDISLDEIEIDLGEDASVTATVENTGNGTEEFAVEFEIDGEVEGNETVELGTNETTEIAFTHAFDEEGEYALAVEGVEAGTVNVVDPDPDIEVTDASLSDEEIDTGENLTVEATVENVGDETDERTIVLEIDGSIEDEAVVELGANETEQIEFIHTFGTDGEYDVSVSGAEAGTVSVNATTGSLVLTVEDELTGDGVDAAFTIWDGDEAVYEGEADSGSLVPSIDVGTYDIVITASEYETKTVESVEIEAAEQSSVSVELTPETKFSVSDASLDETDVEEGEEVTIAADVENDGEVAGEYTAELEIDGSVEETETVELGPDEVESIAFIYRFDDAGEFAVSVGGVDAGTVSVEEDDPSSPSPAPDPEPEPEPVTNVTVDGAQDRVAISITGATTNEAISIPIGHERENETAGLTALDISSTADLDFEATVEHLDERPDGTDVLPAGVEMLLFDVDQSLDAEEIESAALEFQVSVDELDGNDLDPEDLTLYHHVGGEWTERETQAEANFPGGTWEDADDLFPGGTWEEADSPADLFPGDTWEEAESPEELFPGGTWEDIEDHFPGGTWEEADSPADLFPGDTWEEAESPEELFPGGTWDETTISAETPHFSSFALVGEQPDISVIDHSVSGTEFSTGEGPVVVAEVKNAGGADGAHELALEAGGEVAAVEEVSLTEGETATVEFEPTFEDAGEYELELDGERIETVTVDDRTDDTDDVAADGDDAGEVDDTSDAAGDDATPGFGIAIAILALLLMGAFSRRPPANTATRRGVLGLIGGSVIAVGGCLDSDDGRSDAGSDDGRSDAGSDEVGRDTAGSGDPAAHCDRPSTDDREALVPQDEQPIDDLVRSGSSMTPDFSGMISRQETRDDDLEEFAYGSAGHTYDADHEDEFAAHVIEFDRSPPELTDEEIFRFVEPFGGPEYDVAVSVVVDEWVFAAGGSDEDTCRELLAAFPELGVECAEAARVS
ncbi:CARDB domain-containing protein [Halovivax gelatinilyticus]|uniref:CARDB domain-containing protein n=1 Tax=Halovivax gelatinilyticus TaxID=2961597 RepID=UPI0020CA88DC|nr:CARDB domain-containing protein [Halovivax gelatinilyticus]